MPSSPLQKILAQYRATSQTEREKGTYFEELIRTYFRFEASYADLYSDVWLFADWAKEIGTPEFGISAKDTGIDLVVRIIGCWKALSKQGLTTDLALDPNPMKRAVDFCQVIERQSSNIQEPIALAS